MTRALWVVRSSGALPATVVMPSSSVWRAATTIAIASSWPGSQSRMIGGRGVTSDMRAEHAIAARHTFARGVEVLRPLVRARRARPVRGLVGCLR